MRERSGSLTLRTRAGKPTWCAQVTVDDPSKPGKTRRELYSLETDDRAVAKRKLRRLVASLAQAQPARPEVARVAGAPDTVREYAEAWCEKRKAQGVVSASDEKRNLDTHVLPLIGKLPIDAVRASDIEAVLEDSLAKGLAPITVRQKIRGVCARLFKSALRRKLIRENPLESVEFETPKETRKRRVILTDAELSVLLAYPDGDVEIKILGLVSRTIGGARTSDLNRLAWTSVDTDAFAWVVLPREKVDGGPQRLEVPDIVRPMLRAWWERAGEPATGPVFPSRRGPSAGKFKGRRGISYAARLRRDLRRALDAHRATVAKDLGVPLAKVPQPRPELFAETDDTLPVDFHSFRRAYATALAEADVNVQRAMALADHRDARTHMRYVAQTRSMGQLPAAAVPQLQHPVSIAARQTPVSGAPGWIRTSDHRLRRPHDGRKSAQNEQTDEHDGDTFPEVSSEVPNVSQLSQPDPDAAFLTLLRLATDAGDLDTAKRALAELEARRRERAGVVDIGTAKRKRGGK